MICMNVRIEIKYLTDGGRAVQAGSFPLKGRKSEDIAFKWLQQIKRQVTYRELISVTVNKEDDITENVRKLEKAPLE